MSLQTQKRFFGRHACYSAVTVIFEYIYISSIGGQYDPHFGRSGGPPITVQDSDHVTNSGQSPFIISSFLFIDLKHWVNRSRVRVLAKTKINLLAVDLFWFYGFSKLASAPRGHFPPRGEGWVEKLNLFRLWQMGSHSKGKTVQNSIFLVSSCQCQTLIKYLVLIALN